MLLRIEGRCCRWLLAAWLLALALAACSGAPPEAPPPPSSAISGETARVEATDAAGPAAPAGSLIDTELTAIAVGWGHMCGLKPDGTPVCWGDLPAAAPQAGLTQLAAGRRFSCGLSGAGELHCWGDDLDGKISDAPAGEFRAVALGRRHGCALTAAEGRAVCWGSNNHGQTAAPPDISFTEIQAGWGHSCGLTAAGGLRCWGSNAYGEGAAVSGSFSSLAAGGRNTCALRDDAAAFCQGESQLAPPARAFTQIAAAGHYACGLTDGGALECWGGAGPLPAPPGEFTAVNASRRFACALRPNGRAACWDPSTYAASAFEGRLFFTPVELFPWPGGGLAVAENRGSLSLHRPDAPPRALLDLTGRVYCCATESGLLGVALDPEFPQFPYLYVWYTGRREDQHFLRLSRIPAPGGIPDPAGERPLLELPQGKTTRLHNGGGLRFGPDGMLYLGIGDNEQPPEAQNRASLWGSILRIDVRGATPQQPYRIPPDNPLLDTPGARPEIWAYGLRNPWRMSFDSQGRLWVGDVGANAQEEISIAPPGGNLGWPVFEGRRCNAGEAQCAARPGAVPPVFAYERAEGCAVIWGGEYRGRALPQLRGAHLFADYCSRDLWVLEDSPETGWQRRKIAEAATQINGFGADGDGEIHLLNTFSPILKLERLIAAAPAEP